MKPSCVSLRWAWLPLTLLLASTVELHAAELTPKERDLFEVRVRPTLVAHCIRCHGEAKQEGGLRLTSLAEILKGGESGAAVVPGKPSESLLLEALRYESLEMPPDGRLDKQLVDGIASWISAGAPWPRGVVLKPTPKITAEDRAWWCFQSIADPPVPNVHDDGWCRNELDRFIFARLAEKGVRPAREAGRRELRRRVHFAVTGLPPKQADVQADVPSTTGSAAEVRRANDYETLVDRLLSSPAYGENQARFWLDLVRYADSDGYRADHARPEAKHYRDYVIRSFNNDKPYDRFVMEQLAGDEIDPGNRDALTATMYLRHWIYEWNQRDVELQWQEILNDVTETTADVFLALGLKCARCHDHKFDPLLQADYYRLKSFFAAFQPREDMPLADLATRTAHHKQYATWQEATKDIRKRLHEIESPQLLKHATREGVDKFVTEIRQMISKRPGERSAFEHQIAGLASRQFDLHPDKLPEWLDEKTEAERQQLRARLAEFDSMKPKPLPQLKFVASDVGTVAPATFIPDDPDKTPIEPGFPAVLDDAPAKIIPPPVALQSTGRRTALARWLTSSKNPLTARVIVNRIWQQHFSRGLAATSSDFGHLGEPPTHPKLLDWLATRFMEDGWSLKKLHRRILTSSTYRQTSLRSIDDRLTELDPGNRLLWRMESRRLTGEEITDAVLTASGELDVQRRAIYRTVLRNRLDPLMALFDMPDRIRSSGKRHQTTTPTQALLLSNGSWLHERAAAMTRRLSAKPDSEFIQTTHQTLYGRDATPEEVEAAEQFLDSYESVTLRAAAASEDELLKQMPHGGGKSIEISSKSPLRVAAAAVKSLEDGDFSVEAVVLLRSLYKDASVRTIAAHWTGDQKKPGWAFGVTSEKSRYKPRNLILQLVGGAKEGDKLQYEVVASNLRPELNRPYYLAVSVKLDDPSKQGITFYLKDLSRTDAKLQTAHVPHKAIRNIHGKAPLSVGGRAGKHTWDGLIDRVQVHSAALTNSQLDFKSPNPAIVDWRFENKDVLGHDSSKVGNHAQVNNGDSATLTPKEAARAGFIHALFNSNELIYVD